MYIQSLKRAYEKTKDQLSRDTLDSIIQTLFNLAEDYEKQLHDGMEKSKHSAYQILCGGNNGGDSSFPSSDRDAVSISTCVNELDCNPVTVN